MPTLDQQRQAVFLKNKNSDNYDEIDNTSCMKDRSVIRKKPTGIPTPGSKKNTNHLKSKISALHNNRNNNNSKLQQKSTDDLTVTERNQRNLNQCRNGLKSPVKSLISHYQSPSSLNKQDVTNAKAEVKPSSRLPQKSNLTPTKAGKAKAPPPPPPPRSVKSEVTSPLSKLTPTSVNVLPHGNRAAGNGLGGGSVPQKGFSFVRNARGSNISVATVSDESPEDQLKPAVNNSIPHRALREPSALHLSPARSETSKKSQEQTGLKQPLNTPSKASSSLSKQNAPAMNTPVKITANSQTQFYSESPIASHTEHSTVTTSSNATGEKAAISKVTIRSLSLRQSNIRSQEPDNSVLPQSNELSVPESKLLYSNIKRSASPERRATINSKGAFTGYCKGGRSFKGQQPKPVSIPIVPDVTTSRSTPTAKGPETTAPFSETKPEASDAEKDNCVSEKLHTKPPVEVPGRFDVAGPRMYAPDETSEKKENKNNTNKKGLFGLRKLVLNKTSARSSPVPQKTVKEDALKDITDIPLNSSNQAVTVLIQQSPSPISLRSFASSESTPCSTTSSHISHSSLKLSPVPSKKATIPKTDLLHTLLTHRTQKAGEAEVVPDSENSLTCDASSDVSSVKEGKDCVDDTAYSTSIATPGLTGVLKNSNLMKSVSSSSIPSDSGASNLSATPSLKTKKVSFQNDITVCDANGISTFSNGLRYCETDEHSDLSLDQSLSSDATEQDCYRTDDKIVRSWRNETAIRERKEVDESNVIKRRYRPATPGIMDLAKTRESVENLYSNIPWSLETNYFPSRTVHQSAVAAAIESISDKLVPSSKIENRQDNLILTRNSQTGRGYEQFAVSCASPVPFVTRHKPPYKEEWSPLRRPLPIESSQREAPVDLTLRSSVDSSAKTSSQSTMQTNNFIDDPPRYFETQGHKEERNQVTPSKENFQTETPPYYECCEPSKPILFSELYEAFENKHSQTRPQVADDAISSKPHGGNQEIQLSNADVAPAVQPTSSASALSGTKHVQNNVDGPTSKRMIAMERQLASLTGVVESIITTNDGSQPVMTEATADMTQQELRKQILKMRETARELKEQLNDLKSQQRTNMEKMNEIVNEKTKDLTQFISTTAGAQHRPLRIRRIRLDQERHAYGLSASRTEQQLFDVEAAVEELRNEVVERRCRVNAREVEALVLQLSQAGRTVAHLKGSFPTLCEEIRAVGSGESEVIHAEEKFVKAEPSRLDEQLKRCKQLTSTLFTLKKLATVQEARSKTPTSFNQLRPNTPSQMSSKGAWEDPKIHRNKVLEDVKKLNVDHSRRMESLQDAEISWTRRRKFILEHDSKKLEKALEIAEKALNKTDYISHIEQRRRAHLVQLYKQRAVEDRGADTNLTHSESSSIESLPPPPLPLEHTDLTRSSRISSYSRYQHHSPSVIPLPSSHPDLTKRTGVNQHPLISPDVRFLNSSPSPKFGKRVINHANNGSLPRNRSTARHPGFGISPSSGRRTPSDSFPNHHWRQTPVQQIERSRSVTPQHWNTGRATPTLYNNGIYESQELTDGERRRLLKQQQLTYMEKNQRLKEQYSKLQHLQRMQRQQTMKNSSSLNNAVYLYQPTSSAPTAKSSDV